MPWRTLASSNSVYRSAAFRANPSILVAAAAPAVAVVASAAVWGGAEVALTTGQTTSDSDMRIVSA